MGQTLSVQHSPVAQQPAIYAHTSQFGPSELLSDHLREVAELAASYATAFNARDWGRLSGAWHDLGKIQPEFQDYIQGRSASGPPPAWGGGVLALKRHRPPHPT